MGVFGCAEVREERCVVCPSFGVRGEGEVHVEGDMVDEGAYAAIAKVYGCMLATAISPTPFMMT